MKFKPSRLSLAIGALLGASVPLGVVAQDAPSNEEATQLDAIKVTARRVEETLQEVPLSISVIDEETIERRGLERINDIARYTPGFSFRSGFGREGDRPVIRGQSNIQGEANAAFFIDGVFVNGNISGYGLDNLEQIEVIRGPQSALFGRRTFSGAINFITRKPSNTPEGKLSMSVASDSEREFAGNYSGAIVDDLLTFQGNVRYYEFGGQYRNAVTGIKDLGGQKTTSAGGAFFLTPNDKLDFTLRFNYAEDQDEHYAIGRLGDPLNRLANGLPASDINGFNNCFLPIPAGGTFAGSVRMQTRTRGYLCGTAQQPDIYAINTDQFRLAGFEPGLERENFRTSLQGNYLFDNGWTLTSTSAYNTTESYSAVDQDFSSVRGFNGAFETIDFGRSRDWSQEFRIATDQDLPLRGQFGYYHYNEKALNGWSANLGGFNTPPTFSRTRPVQNPTRPGLEITNQALFALVEYDFTEQLTGTLEARYAEDEIDIVGRSTNTLTVAGRPTTFVRDFSKSATFDNVLPRATLRYEFNDDLNVYGLAAKGNKPGGFNTAVESSILTEAGRAALLAEGLDVFEEEEAWTYELGMKSQWFDKRLTFNAALYRIDWDNQQLTETRPTPRVDGGIFITSFTSNLGKSEVTGLELEADWQIDEHWNLRAIYALQDTEIKNFRSQDQADLFCGANAIDLTQACANARGAELPRVPKHQAGLGLTYNGTLDNGWGWYVSGDANYESSRYAQVDNLLETGDSTLVNLRGGLSIGDNWEVTLFVRNATDDDTPEDILRYVNPALFIAVPNVLPAPAAPITLVNPRDFVITPPRKRQYGLTVNYRF